MVEAIETTVTYLEMTEPRHRLVPPPANLKVMLVKLEKPTVHFYRYLYHAVGNDYAWTDRKALDDAALAGEIRATDVEVWVLYVGGVPAGYFEVDGRDKDAAELKYFGLVREYQGRGLGKWLMAEAISACWSRQPKKITVNTCTLDGPAALPLYQRMGFVPVRQEKKVIEFGR